MSLSATRISPANLRTGMITSHGSMTRALPDNYKARIRKARERVKSGYYTAQEDLEKEMEQW